MNITLWIFLPLLLSFLFCYHIGYKNSFCWTAYSAKEKKQKNFLPLCNHIFEGNGRINDKKVRKKRPEQKKRIDFLIANLFIYLFILFVDSFWELLHLLFSVFFPLFCTQFCFVLLAVWCLKTERKFKKNKKIKALHQIFRVFQLTCLTFYCRLF